MSMALTLGALRESPFSEQRLASRRVKDELRENLMARLRQNCPIFPGIVGYEDTVVPQIVNAILSRHNFILLGLRGQAKSRILRALTGLLDPQMPYIAGCEIHDNPYAPICRRCRELVQREEEATPIAWLAPQQRYVEKLATRTGQRIHRPLRTASPRQSRHFRHQRTARSRGKNSGRLVQHHAGRRRTD